VRKLHKEELHDLYSSPTVARVIKSRMRWAWHIARRGEGCRVSVGKPEGKRPLRDQGLYGRIIISCIFRKWDVGYGLD
jgi:hypothetical protein